MINFYVWTGFLVWSLAGIATAVWLVVLAQTARERYRAYLSAKLWRFMLGREIDDTKWNYAKICAEGEAVDAVRDELGRGSTPERVAKRAIDAWWTRMRQVHASRRPLPAPPTANDKETTT